VATAQQLYVAEIIKGIGASAEEFAPGIVRVNSPINVFVIKAGSTLAATSTNAIHGKMVGVDYYVYIPATVVPGDSVKMHVNGLDKTFTIPANTVVDANPLTNLPAADFDTIVGGGALPPGGNPGNPVVPATRNVVQRSFMVYEQGADGTGRMLALPPGRATGVPLPAFSSGPVTPTVGTVAGQAFLNTTNGQAVVWDGVRWNPIIPSTITSYPTDAAVVADPAATGTYAFSQNTGNFFVRFNPGTPGAADKWRQIGINTYATQAGLLSDTPAEGTFAYATDTALFFLFQGTRWHPESEMLMAEPALLASRPALTGQRGIATDTGRNYTWVGNRWVGDPFRTYATQVALLADMTPANGTIAIALDTSHVFMKSAAAWVGLNAAAQNPIGEIIMFPSMTSPANFLLCDGRAYDRVLYPALHIALGSPANAVLPDLRGQFIRGAAAGRNPLTTQAQSTARPVNAFTGTTSTDGWHSHSFQRGTGSNFSGDIKYPDGKFSPINAEGGGSAVNGGINANGNHTHTLSINGGGDSETRPANVALAFHIRATQ
jgi:hypothetical protein